MRASIPFRLATCALAACTVATCASQAFASSTASVKISDCDKALKRPRTVVLTCGDGTIALEKLSWSSFGGSSASAKGTISVNACEPNCASSRSRSYPVKIVASRRKSCNGKLSVYGSVAITFTGAKPKDANSLKRYALACPS